MRDIWAQGAAQGVWKEMMRVVEGGREERVEWKVEGEVMSVMVDMMFSSFLLFGRLWSVGFSALGHGIVEICKLDCRSVVVRLGWYLAALHGVIAVEKVKDEGMMLCRAALARLEALGISRALLGMSG